MKTRFSDDLKALCDLNKSRAREYCVDFLTSFGYNRVEVEKLPLDVLSSKVLAEHELGVRGKETKEIDKGTARERFFKQGTFSCVLREAFLSFGKEGTISYAEIFGKVDEICIKQGVRAENSPSSVATTLALMKLCEIIKYENLKGGKVRYEF